MFHLEKTGRTPGAAAPAWQEKALPVIPFSPEWRPPAATAQATDQNLANEQRRIEPAHVGLLPVIFTEADSDSREMFRALGEQWGYRIIAANGGANAMEALRQITGAAVVVVSRNMGDMDGLEFCRVARRTIRSLYMVLVTERSGTEQFTDTVAAGADDYLITPFDADELRARLHVAARVIQLQAKVAEAQ